MMNLYPYSNSKEGFFQFSQLKIPHSLWAGTAHLLHMEPVLVSQQWDSWFKTKITNRTKTSHTDKDLLSMCCYLESYVICRAIVLWGMCVMCPETYELGRKKCRGSVYGS
jgi:hypothetical protein